MEKCMQSGTMEVSEPVSLSAAIERSKITGEEFCNQCGKGMGFSFQTTHIDDPVRFRNGAFYTEGSGQTCATCATK